MRKASSIVQNNTIFGFPVLKLLWLPIFIQIRRLLHFESNPCSVQWQPQTKSMFSQWQSADTLCSVSGNLQVASYGYFATCTRKINQSISFTLACENIKQTSQDQFWCQQSRYLFAGKFAGKIKKDNKQHSNSSNGNYPISKK